MRVGKGGPSARKQRLQRLGDVTSARLGQTRSLAERGQQQLWLLVPVFKGSELPRKGQGSFPLNAEINQNPGASLSELETLGELVPSEPRARSMPCLEI